MKLYKLTDEHDRTFGGCQWGEGVTHTTSGEGKLCGPGWLHAYTDPLLAGLLNIIHANFQNAHLWEAEGDVRAEDHGLNAGCTRLTTVRQIEMPEISTEQRVRFAVLCALEVYRAPSFVAWARGWLSGLDRTERAAEEAKLTAAWAVAAWAAETAEAAAAAWSARSADARTLAAEAVRVEEAAASAARLAAREEGVNIDIADIARRAVYGKASEAENNGEV
jgi:hypothetical protein